MIRDPFKDETYFHKYLAEENRRIKKFKHGISMVIEQRGAEDLGVRSGFISLTNFMLNKIRAMYSAGCSVAEIRDFFPEVIDSIEHSWDGGHYVKMLWMLSIGVMLNIGDEQFARLESLVRKHELHDSLIEFLIQGKKEHTSSIKGNLLFKDPYAKLVKVIQTDGEMDQVERMKTYLEKYWYKGHRDAGWYDSHKHKDDIYSGYWCFESGAVAKILGLDDSSLKDVPYYPYDMVHYKN
jgi:hypothetical protein